MKTVISVRDLRKTFESQTGNHQKVHALNGLNLDVYEGEILGILGPNGAGKTTFLNIMSTLLLPDAGEARILDIPLIPKNFDRLRRILNMSSGYPNFAWSLTVEENLRFYGRLYGLTGKELSKKIAALVEMFRLGDYAQRRFDELSSGTKQRLSLAKALINDPKIIFLDEPTVGLDPDVAARTRRVVLDIIQRTKVTVLLTTHYMQEAELMCQRVAFIKGGKVLRLAPIAELKARERKKDLEEIFIELAQAPVNVGEEPAAEKIVEPLERSGSEPEDLLSRLRGWLNRCLAFSYRNVLFAMRNFFAFAELLFWPIVSLISIGLLGDFLKLQEQALAFVMTGAITAGVLQVTQLDVAYSLLYEVWSKSMKHTFLTPVGVSENLFGSWATGMIRGIVVFGILSVLAMGFFGFHFPGVGVTLVFLLGIFTSALLLGLLVSLLLLMYGQKAEITAWMFAYLFMLICGIYYPIETLPPFFKFVAQLIPITYFLDYFRQSFGFESQLQPVLLKGFGLTALYLVLGLMLMKHAFLKARQKGIIVRLSE